MRQGRAVTGPQSVERDLQEAFPRPRFEVQQRLGGLVDAAEEQHDVGSGDVSTDGSLCSGPGGELLHRVAEQVDRLAYVRVLQRGPADDVAERAVGGEQALLATATRQIEYT
jgi:hypothetical protein